MSVHATLLEKARQAISELHGDTSVGMQQTVDSLTELADDLELKIDTLQEEIERAEA